METKIYLTRHLQRIDDGSDSSREYAVRWNTIDSKNPNFILNPYLSDYADRHVESVVAKFSEVNVIVTSPFLRCMQTALKIFNKINESGHVIDTIYVDFGLSEYVEEYNFYTLTEPRLNIQSIYDFSLEQFTPEQRALFTILDPTPSIIEFENDAQYGLRIKSTILQIHRTFIGKNILVVSHAYSLQPLVGHELRYLDVFLLEPETYITDRTEGTVSSISGTEYKKKYLKYKEKYIKLKNKN